MSGEDIGKAKWFEENPFNNLIDHFGIIIAKHSIQNMMKIDLREGQMLMF